jgi:hypothetical protein
MKEYGKNMLIVSTYWGEAKSFKLIPINNECPYLEVMYDSTTGLLAVISKSKKQVFHNVPKIDDNGDMIYMKMGKRENGKNYKEERRTIETFQEYYLIEESEIIDFVNTFGVNSDEFNYMVYVEATRKKSNPDIVMPEVAPIMSLDGEVLTK